MYSLKILRLGVSINEKKYILQELDIKERRRRTVDTVKETKTKTKHKKKKSNVLFKDSKVFCLTLKGKTAFVKQKAVDFSIANVPQWNHLHQLKRGSRG